MNPDHPAITDAIFAAFLQCETKAYLLREGANGIRSEVVSRQQDLASSFKQSASEWLKSSVGECECYIGTPSLQMLQQGRYLVVFDPLIASPDFRAQPDALWRMPWNSNAPDAVYSPVRF